MTDEELEDVLGADWEYYLRLWEKYDPYWVAILRALESGDRLTATLLQGELRFEKIKSVMHAILNNGDAGNLLEWQGQGFYNIDRPGKSARDNAYLSDDIFNKFSTTYTIWQPRFHYKHIGPPVCIGVVRVTQQVSFEFLGVVEMFGEIAGWKSPGTADNVGGILIDKTAYIIPKIGIIKIGIDGIFSLAVSYTNPKEYSAIFYEGYSLEWLESGPRWE
jgi:hypothetical protein